MPIQAILWDFDGTLAASLPGIAAAMRQTLAAADYAEPTEPEVRATVGLTLEESMRRLTGGRATEEEIPQLVASYRGRHDAVAAPLVRLFPGARKTLDALAGRGIRSILVSNKGRHGLDQLLGQFELQAAFAHTLSADQVRYRKPDGRLFASSIAPLMPELRAEEFLVVGDTEADLGFARAAGLKACWARYGYGDPVRCSSLVPGFVLDAVSELPAQLDRMAQQ
jgi:phosphoglycolate phosphatase